MPAERSDTANPATAARVATAEETARERQAQAALGRGAACLTCRRRRVKCDGAKPVCTRCAKSAKSAGEDPTTFVCTYDASVPKNAHVRKSDLVASQLQVDKVAALAAEVAELKRQLLNPLPLPHPPPPPPSFQQPQASTSAHTLDQAPPYTLSYDAHNPSAAPSIPVDSSAISFDPATFLSTANPSPFPSYLNGGGGGGGANDTTPPDGVSYSNTSTGATPSSSGVGGIADLSLPNLSSQPDLSTSTTGLFELADLATSSSSTLPAASAFSSDPLDLSFLTSPSSWSLLPSSLYPYPSASLPSPQLLNRLLTVFFTKQHLATGLISESRLRASLLLPKTDPRAPLEGLLHAVVATAGLMVGDGFLDGEGGEGDAWGFGGQGRKYWSGGAGEGGLQKGDGAGAFSEYHAKRAEELIDPSFRKGRQLLQVVQSAALLTFCAYTAGRFAEIWNLGATASRLAVIAGLNHLRPLRPPRPFPSSSSSTNSSSARPHSQGTLPRTGATRLSDKAMLPPPKDEEELRERQMTWWSVFAADRMTSAATDWAQTIDERDVTTLVPELEGGGEEWLSSPLTSPLCLSNPSFFLAHPPHLVGVDQLYIKSLVLLGRVCSFLQRAPEPVGSGWRVENEEGGEADLRESSAFRKLELLITHFRLSVPRDLQWSYVLSSTGRIDNRLLMAHSLVHVVMILLHEPFCVTTISATDSSFVKCYDAAKAIMSTVYELSGSSFEIGLLASFLNWCWSVAGRTLVRALALASRRLDLAAASHLASDVKALIRAMEANRSPVGAATASVLTRLLADPFQVLPSSPPASSRSTQNFSSKYRFSAANAGGGGAAGMERGGGSGAMEGMWEGLEEVPGLGGGGGGEVGGGEGMEGLEELARKVVEEAGGGGGGELNGWM